MLIKLYIKWTLAETYTIKFRKRETKNERSRTKQTRSCVLELKRVNDDGNIFIWLFFLLARERLFQNCPVRLSTQTTHALLFLLNIVPILTTEITQHTTALGLPLRGHILRVMGFLCWTERRENGRSDYTFSQSSCIPPFPLYLM